MCKLTIPCTHFLKPLQPLDGPYSISNLQTLQFETPQLDYGLTYQFKVIYYIRSCVIYVVLLLHSLRSDKLLHRCESACVSSHQLSFDSYNF